MTVSTDSAGNEVYGYNLTPSTSANGRFVAFASDAASLVPGDTNNAGDVFVKDTWTGATTRVSTDSAGGQGEGDFYPESYDPSISADGRYVAFASSASNLVPGDTNNTGDVFVKDTQTGATTRVSSDSAGGQANSSSDYPSISADGLFVAFASDATNLVPGDSNGRGDVFVKDTQTGATTRVSTDSTGAQGEGVYPASNDPSISADGRYVAFASSASNLVPGDTNNTGDVFVKDTLTGATTRVSTDSAGAQANGFSTYPSISADGHYLAFWSSASNLVPGDTNGTEDFFVKDTQTGATTRVSTDSTGGQVFRGTSLTSSSAPSISADGRYVAFMFLDSNLVPGDTNHALDVFVKDTQTGATTRVSTDSAGGQGNNSSLDPSISADGRYVAFVSVAGNLVPGVPGETNPMDDVFLAATPAATSGVQPALTLDRTGIYWASYADYTARLLSVDFDISNTSAGTAYQVRLVGTANTNGASLSSSGFADGFLIAGGSSVPGTLKYHVPESVVSFSTTVYATALDGCGNSYSYPGSYPGP